MNTTASLALVVAAQAALVGTAVAPQLSARLTGDTVLMRVQPVDPIDPFRGAYVTLSYPGLADAVDESRDDSEGGTVFLPLVEEDGYLVADGHRRTRPGSGPYLTCVDQSWQVECGIESLFLPQDEAAEMERVLADGAVAEVRIDGRGNAALVDVRAE